MCRPVLLLNTGEWICECSELWLWTLNATVEQNQRETNSNSMKTVVKVLLIFQIRQQFYFKVLRDYIPLNIFPDVEYCSFMRKKDKNSYFYSILKVVNKHVPGLIHQCPYQV